jgi:Uncharacterized protein conserved in bacteria (DUF2155)
VRRDSSFRLLCLSLVLAATACRQRSTPDPEVRMAISHEPAASSAQPGSAAQPIAGTQPGGAEAAAPVDVKPGGVKPGDVPTRLEVPPEVAAAYSGIRIGWRDKSNGQQGTIEVPLGGGAPLPDPTLVVRADVFLPAFTMGAGAITSDGVEPQNPAARITVFQNGKEIFGGWLFARFPDVHPFTHPRYELRLEGGIARDAKKTDAKRTGAE